MHPLENPLKYLSRVLSFVLALTLNLGSVLAVPGDLDGSFVPGTVVSTAGNPQVVLQPDGKAIIVGSFTSINSVSRGRIARLHPDGSLDASFLNGLPGANGPVFCLALQNNGQILIGGAFTAVNGIERNRIARLNSDGSLDLTFLNLQSGLDDWVQSIAIQSDGKILIGGYFTLVNGVSRNLIARLNSDGLVDNTFLNGLAGANDGVFTMALQGDGKVVIGGAFTVINGFVRNYVARLNADGSVDEQFLNGLEGPNGGVNAMALQSDGKIILGGSFVMVNGTARGRIARLNTDGSLDSSFLNFRPGANGFVYSVALQADGRLLLGGAFSSVNGTPANRVARLHPDGTSDGWFLSRSSGPNSPVASVAVQADGRVLISGDFTAVNGVTRNQVARLLIDYGPPRIEDYSMQNGFFRGRLFGMPGQALVLQGSTNFVNWTMLSTNVLGNEPPIVTDVQAPNFPFRFYRLLKL